MKSTDLIALRSGEDSYWSQHGHRSEHADTSGARKLERKKFYECMCPVT